MTPRAAKAATAMFCMAWMQVGLGVTTLLTYVPTPVAASHQAGALVTLSTALWLSHELKLMKVIKHVPNTLDLSEFNVNVMTRNNGAHQRSPYGPGTQKYFSFGSRPQKFFSL